MRFWWRPWALKVPVGQETFADDEIDATRAWLKQKSLTIAGGTKEVQMNIIAKRVLGLPDA